MMKLSFPIFRLKRNARVLAREEGIALNEALDRIARMEGFQAWSHLAKRHADQKPAARLLSRLVPSDLVLVGARPNNGKTFLTLELIVEAAREGRRTAFFSLDFSEADVTGWLDSLTPGWRSLEHAVTIDISDGICAEYIVDRLKESPPGSVSVIDYLQLLDQKRSHPEVAEQVRTLKNFAEASGQIIVLISQIDRSFDPGAKPLPSLADVRLPNPVDLTLFTKTCFLHDGQARLDNLRAA